MLDLLTYGLPSLPALAEVALSHAIIGGILAGLGALGPVFGGMAKGREEARAIEAQRQGRVFDTEADIFRTQEGIEAQDRALMEKAGLDRANLGISAPGARTRQAIIGDLLGGMQDVRLNVPGLSGGATGGIRASALGPNARKAGRVLSRQALEALLTGSDIPAMPTAQDIGPGPSAPAAPEGNFLDTILNIGGAAGGVSEAINQLMNERSVVPMPRGSHVNLEPPR